ncbi:ferritin-like domain-containing protein [Chitinispirillales bacterium ANBcel5]|uniref:ferritin-like domain-containing protein n=1 Tax=Cellulosispirillum alkaliphilum TaxID=3039283 RepID=UPI002A556931|nr:ferritin-like domain-containing protein [Chitinispirillales bacterium ANBcel5]
MENKEIARQLKNLTALDMEAAREYSWALENIKDEGLCEQLCDFKEDHEEHVQNLSRYIRQLGEKPPRKNEIGSELKHDGKKGQYQIEDILRTLMRDEKIVSDKYEKLLDQVTIPQIAADLENDYEDDLLHLQTIRELLSETY